MTLPRSAKDRELEKYQEDDSGNVAVNVVSAATKAQLDALFVLQQIDMRGECIDSYPFVLDEDGLIIVSNSGEIISYD